MKGVKWEVKKEVKVEVKKDKRWRALRGWHTPQSLREFATHHQFYALHRILYPANLGEQILRGGFEGLEEQHINTLTH